MRTRIALLGVPLLLVCAGCASEPSDPNPVVATSTLTEPTSIELTVDLVAGGSDSYVLERDADRVVELLDDLPGRRAGDPPGCPDDAGPTVELVIHGDHADRTVVAETFGCQTVTGWGEDRTNGRELFQLIFELLERQRVASLLTDPVPAECPRPLWPQLTIFREPTPHWDALALLAESGIGPPYPAVAVRLCRYQATGSTSVPTSERLVEGDAAEALRQQVVDDMTLGAGYPCPLETARADVLVFVDAAGGSFEVRVSQDECYGIVAGSLAYGHGKADPDLLASIDSAFA